MAMVFEDRVATYPNRYKVTPTNGDPEYYVVLERADDPTIAGTPLNSDTFNGILNEIESVLPDVTSADNGKVLTVTNGSWGKGTLTPPTLNSEKKLTEPGYYHIQMESPYNSSDKMNLGVFYWDGMTDVAFYTSGSLLSEADLMNVRYIYFTIFSSGKLYCKTANHYLGNDTLTLVTEYSGDFYTAKIG